MKTHRDGVALAMVSRAFEMRMRIHIIIQLFPCNSSNTEEHSFRVVEAIPVPSMANKANSSLLCVWKRFWTRGRESAVSQWREKELLANCIQNVCMYVQYKYIQYMHTVPLEAKSRLKRFNRLALRFVDDSFQCSLRYEMGY